MSTIAMLNVSMGTLRSHHVTPVWCMSFPFVPRRLRAMVLTIVQVPSITQIGYPWNHDRLYHRERYYDAHSRDRGGIHTPSRRLVAELSFSGSSCDLQWVQGRWPERYHWSRTRFVLPPPPFAEQRMRIDRSNEAPSRTSSNNWINFCKTVNKPLTNGQQVQGTRTVPIHSPRDTRLIPRFNLIRWIV